MSTQSFSERLLGDQAGLGVPRRVIQLGSVLGFLVVWWALVRFGVLGFEYLADPIETGTNMLAYLAGEPMASGGTIYLHAAYSTFRVVFGVGIAALLAVPLGLAIGTSQRFEDYTFPALEILRPIPPVAWVPISVLLLPALGILGVEVSLAVLFVVFIGAFFPILINTVEGVRTIEEEYTRAAHSLGAEGLQVFRYVVFPATLPSILTGISISIGLGWITVVAAEIIAGNYGLGYTIFQAYRLLQTDVVLVGMVVIGVLGYASSALVNRYAARRMPWSERESR